MAVIVQRPSVSPISSQPVVSADFTYVHDTVSPSFSAVTTTAELVATSPRSMNKLGSEVSYPVLELPVISVAWITGASGVAGVAVMITMVVGDDGSDVFPTGSVRMEVSAHSPSASSGNSQPSTVDEAT
jgi:hypothetical protein